MAKPPIPRAMAPMPADRRGIAWSSARGADPAPGRLRAPAWAVSAAREGTGAGWPSLLSRRGGLIGSPASGLPVLTLLDRIPPDVWRRYGGFGTGMAGELEPEILLAAACTGLLADRRPTPDGIVTGAAPPVGDMAPDLGEADRLPREDGSTPGVELWLKVAIWPVARLKLPAICCRSASS